MFLHGWGGDVRSFAGASEYFALRGYACLRFSFPPFGGSDMPPRDWALCDYSRLTLSVLDAFGAESAVFVAHSFGARVALDIASGEDKRRVVALALTGAAGVKPRRGLSYRIKRMKFARDKRKGRDVSRYYSPDWLALPERMRGIFSRIVSLDLTDRLRNITCPTALFWGDCDRETPMYMCRRIKRRVRGSEIIRLKGGHFAYAEDHFTFVTALAERVEKWIRLSM